MKPNGWTSYSNGEKPCKKCGKVKLISEYYSYKNTQGNKIPLSNCKLCHKKSPPSPHHNKIMLKYLRSNKGIKTTKNRIKQYDAGIYGVFYDCKLVYIGESVEPYRRKTYHFSHEGKRGGKLHSKVATALANGELQRDRLRFKMFEFIDDTPTRKQREECLIQRYKPLYNDLYV